MARHRVLLSLKDESYESLKRFSELSGVPIATFIGQLIEESLPQINDLYESLRLAQKSPGKALGKMIEDVKRYQELAEQLKNDLDKDKKRLK